MEVPELSFEIWLQCIVDAAELRRWFDKEWKDLDVAWTGESDGYTEQNWISIGYEYEDWPKPESKRYRILVAPRHNPSPTQTDFERQVEFARLLLLRFTDKGCPAKYVGFFEEHL